MKKVKKTIKYLYLEMAIEENFHLHVCSLLFKLVAKILFILANIITFCKQVQIFVKKQISHERKLLFCRTEVKIEANILNYFDIHYD